MWLDFAFQELFGLQERLSEQTADHYFDTISEKLSTPEFLPRALYERFNLEVLATTDSPLDPLADHQAIRVRLEGADSAHLPSRPGRRSGVRRLCRLRRQTWRADRRRHPAWNGYLNALRKARARSAPSAARPPTTAIPPRRPPICRLRRRQSSSPRARRQRRTDAKQELFRAQMLTEMARMSLEDGLVMQIHPGSVRNHNRKVYERYGRDMGADIPRATNYVDALRPLLDRFGNEPGLTIILFTLDESTISRELAPLAGHYPCLRLGPPWWFHDSPEGMMRFREQATETAGFYNTVGFNDDTRAFLSIPARHDVARRIDCAFLARLVAEHRLEEDEAFEVAHDLAYGLVKKAYRL